MNTTKPLLVTGAAGFVGARFVESCTPAKIPVVSVDRKDYFTSRPEHRGVEFGKIVDRDDLFQWLIEEQPQFQGIVHLGACTDTTELNEDYLRKTNLEYSQFLWHYAAKQKIPFVYASSAATYGGGELGYDDDESLIQKLKPLNPYGESKRLFDLWALDQEKKKNTPPSWAGFKFFNVYGFGERHKTKMSSVVVQAFDQIRKTGRMKLFKSHREDIRHGEQMRDFIYVEDVVNVLHFALNKPIKSGIFNLCSGKARSFLDLVKAVFTELKLEEVIEFIDTPMGLRERYQYFTEAKMDRLKKEGYTQPFHSLEEGVRKYVALLKKDAL